MTEQLHRLIDSGAEQVVINERVAGLIENAKRDLDRIGSDHERRIRYLERTMAWMLGISGGIGAVVGLTITIIKMVAK